MGFRALGLGFGHWEWEKRVKMGMGYIFLSTGKWDLEKIWAGKCDWNPLPLQDPLLKITFTLFLVIWLAKCPITLLELNSTTAKQIISRVSWKGLERNEKGKKKEKCSFAQANLLPGYIRQVKKKTKKQSKHTKMTPSYY